MYCHFVGSWFYEGKDYFLIGTIIFLPNIRIVYLISSPLLNLNRYRHEGVYVNSGKKDKWNDIKLLVEM